MNVIIRDNIRRFRLCRHHLDTCHQAEGVLEAAGACGLQNSPPGAWETALYNRVSSCLLEQIDYLLYSDKSLLQAWSLRGAPYVFPTAQNEVFLSALIPEDGEEWIYTKGIGLALDYLEMGFEELLAGLVSVISLLDHQTVKSKVALDRMLAEALLPLIPQSKRDLWNDPSMYGAPDVQTVGGAAVSFLLRPCAMMGLVVFGERAGQSPCFTSYSAWTGETIKRDTGGSLELVRKFLRCYGPATAGDFAAWLGCSLKQARRMWAQIADEMMPVKAGNRTAFILIEDRAMIADPPGLDRAWLLLGAHDPYLDLRDRELILPDKALHRKLWRTTANPGAVIYQGEAVGMWTAKSKPKGLELEAELWKDVPGARRSIDELAQNYAAFRRQNVIGLQMAQ